MNLAPRSGLAWKNSIDVGAGVVDYDYRGNVGVILFNHSNEDFVINAGDRVAQLILERISMAAIGILLIYIINLKSPISRNQRKLTFSPTLNVEKAALVALASRGRSILQLLRMRLKNT